MEPNDLGVEMEVYVDPIFKIEKKRIFHATKLVQSRNYRSFMHNLYRL